MCSAEPTRREVIRLGVLGAAGALTIGACGRPADGVQVVPAAPPDTIDPPDPIASDSRVEVMPGLSIHPRSAWGADLPAKLSPEPETVRFVLVHHTASSNSYDDPRSVIRSTFSFHAGPAKNWGDVAYHFFVARDGSVWEGRAGSLDGPVTAAASGGNQGWAQLVCLIGNHVDHAPTAAAQDSLVATLKWLTWRYGLDTDPEATIDYVSRGSDKHPAGTTVTTPVISGHRDATYTACPGDAAYALLPTWRRQVSAMPDPVYPQTGRYRSAERLHPIQP